MTQLSLLAFLAVATRAAIAIERGPTFGPVRVHPRIVAALERRAFEAALVACPRCSKVRFHPEQHARVCHPCKMEIRLVARGRRPDASYVDRDLARALFPESLRYLDR